MALTLDKSDVIAEHGTYVTYVCSNTREMQAQQHSAAVQEESIEDESLGPALSALHILQLAWGPIYKKGEETGEEGRGLYSAPNVSLKSAHVCQSMTHRLTAVGGSEQ